MISESTLLALCHLARRGMIDLTDEEFGMICNRPVEGLPDLLLTKVERIVVAFRMAKAA